jgi:hypothetical protein
MGIDLCGSHRVVNIQFNYEGHILNWERYVRVPLDPSNEYI